MVAKVCCVWVSFAAACAELPLPVGAHACVVVCLQTQLRLAFRKQAGGLADSMTLVVLGVLCVFSPLGAWIIAF
jgi:hypothetical protein